MGVNFGMLLESPLLILGLILGLFVLKGLVLWVIARMARLPADESPLFILLLAQGGEFAFVLLGLGATHGAIAPATAQAIILAVALSMLATPFLLVAHDRLLMPRIEKSIRKPAADTPEQGKVIIAGLGRVGQVVARLLNASGIHPTVLDDDPDHVEQSRKFGFRVFYGDARASPAARRGSRYGRLPDHHARRSRCDHAARAHREDELPETARHRAAATCATCSSCATWGGGDGTRDFPRRAGAR